MAKPIMIQGTMSSVGKSLITAGLCKIFKEDGYRVSPFKSQNMSLNSFVTKDGLEIGRAQAMQAECCGIPPDVRMNPILLKPVYENGSQVIVNGEVIGNMKAQEYFNYRKELVPKIIDSYNSLSKENDIIVIEGAGSPAEINLKKDDIVNMGIAKLFNSPVILVGDIDRGGIFASIYGTVELVDKEEKNYIKSVIINKFRGDMYILKPGIEMLENLININVAGVIPYMDINLDDEDSLCERFVKNKNKSFIDIAVIKFPMISNFTDFNSFENIEGVSLRYVKSINEFGNPDLIILPGSKNTIDDLLWIRSNGIEANILKEASKGTLIIGVCGGYQMLGLSIKDSFNVESGKSINGLGLLDCNTFFKNSKTRKQVKGKFKNIDGVFKNLSDIEFEGYEIHMGDTVNNSEGIETTYMYNNSIFEGTYKDNILGVYVHGIFDKKEVTKAIIECICKNKNIDFSKFKTFDFDEYKNEQYNFIADVIRKNLNMDSIYEILNKGI